VRIQPLRIAASTLLLVFSGCLGQLEGADSYQPPPVPRPDAAVPFDTRLNPPDVARPVDRPAPPDTTAVDASVDTAATDTNTGPCLATNPVVPDPVWVDPALLGPDAVADRLVKWLFRLGPQPDITALVAGCRPFTAGHVRALVDRMLLDDRARAGIFAQFQTWLVPDHLARFEPPAPALDPAVFPPLSPGLRAAMLEEIGRVGLHTLHTGGTFEQLMTAPYSLLDGQLAALYGVPGIAPTAPFTLVPFPQDAQRAGVLTSAAVLSTGMLPMRHSPIRRGKFISERLLCQEVPPPPAFIPPAITRPDPGKTLRQTFEQHLKMPQCVPCHRLMDSGWALEPFDALGRLRPDDNGLPFDTRADWSQYTGGTTGQVQGPRDLGRALAQTRESIDCFVDHMFGIALGFDRPLGDRLTSRTTPALRNRFREFRGNVRELLLDIGTTADFHRQRR
jgi:hypothetical protein